MRDFISINILIIIIFFSGCEDAETFVQDVTVSPTSASIEVGDSLQFTANITDENGDNVDADIVWSLSNNNGENTVATISNTGLLIGLSTGNVNVVATAEGKSGTATITIGLGSITLSPSSPTLSIGDTLTFSALYISSTGDTVSNASYNWSSSDSMVFSVSDNGTVTALSTGSGTVTATHSSGAMGQTTINIGVGTIELNPTSATITVGDSLIINATYTNAAGSLVSDPEFSWSSSDTSVLTIDQTGKLFGISSGNASVTATYATGASALAQISVDPGTLLLSVMSAQMTVGDTLSISTVYISIDGDTTQNPEVTWFSSDPSVLTLDTDLQLITAQSEGSTTIKATYITGAADSMIVTIEDIGSFNIAVVDKESTGDASQSQPELIRFISDSEGVIVNSKTNSLDFITITTVDLSMSGESVLITDDPDVEASSIDVSVDESIIAVVVSKGSCEPGELYLVDVSSREKFGPYELGYNPDAVDIAVDNEFVVVVNEYDYEDGTAGCTEPFYPGVTIYDISQGLNNATLIKQMKITHLGDNGNLAEPEGVKIAPDGETVYMTLQESNQIGWFSILSPPDTLQNYTSFTNPEHEPDGIWVSNDGSIVCTAGEYDGTIGILIIGSDGAPGAQYYANLADDLPSNWDWTDERKGIEPEEVVIVEEGSKMFAMVSLQDPGAVVVYNITDPTNPIYDSGAIVELIDYTTEVDGSSQGEPEGLAYKNGYVLVSNTEDPSVCLLKASWAE